MVESPYFHLDPGEEEAESPEDLPEVNEGGPELEIWLEDE